MNECLMTPQYDNYIASWCHIVCVCLCMCVCMCVCVHACIKLNVSSRNELMFNDIPV